MKTSLLILFISTLFILPEVQGADNMKAFPPAENGKVRYVLHLPAKANESLFRVELIVGKTVMIDEANNYFLGGAIEKEVITGWGFPRYIVDEIGPMAGTLMMVPPDAKKVERFIRLGGDPYLIRYNSRLPVVVYVPEGATVRYRIWSADEDSQKIEEG
jgi:ecotin